MTKENIVELLFDRGIRSQYSGKDKCFYVNITPDDIDIKKIFESGFKIKIWSSKRVTA